MSTEADEVTPLTPEQRDAVNRLIEAAKELVHVSPANELRTAPAFVAALGRGEASVRVELVLPSGAVRVFAYWPEMQADELLCTEIRVRRADAN